MAEENNDLYCIRCRYSLRGLPGEQIRCPECGEINPLSGEPVPERFMRRQLRRAESCPWWCATFFLAAVVFGSVTILLTWQGGEEGVACVGALTLIVILAWVATALTVKDWCGGQPGWRGVLVRAHLAGAILPGVVLTLIVWSGLHFMDSTKVSPRQLLVHLALCAGGIGLCLWLGSVLRRRLRDRWREMCLDQVRLGAAAEVRYQMRHSGRRLAGGWLDVGDVHRGESADRAAGGRPPARIN